MPTERFVMMELEFKITKKRQDFINILAEEDKKNIASFEDVKQLAEKYGMKFPYWVKEFRTEKRGEYDFTPLFVKEKINRDRESVLIPEPFPGYVEFGHFNDIKKITESKIFYPIYVTGLSGNGKTIMIEEICSRLGREMIRSNITGETDEDDLIGGFRLIKGETVWHDGPVITAMKKGAILLLDEVDLGTPKLMCLQPVLEGKSVYIKKINEVVNPEPGFNIIATANTKGKGSESGQFIGTMVMNEAFLERFAITLEQEYPPKKTEIKILEKCLEKYNKENNDFIQCLVNWADKTRKWYQEGEIEDLISTRRLVHITNAYHIFDEDKEKAIEVCLNRFNEDSKKSFIDYYKKIDAELTEKELAEERKRQGLDKENTADDEKTKEPEPTPSDLDFPF